MSSNEKKYDFTGKVALVTGSSSGIGAAIAIQFAAYGAQVVITGRNEEALSKIGDEVAKASEHGLKPLKIIGNLLTDDALPAKLIDETVNKFGRLDILVNNAGGSTPLGTLSSPNLIEEFDNVFKVNLRSVVELIQRSVLHLQATQGNIINISSMVAIKPVCIIFWFWGIHQNYNIIYFV